MSDKETLLRRLGSLDFAMWELHIFLDTHPNNKRAMKMYDDYMEKSMVLKEEYQDRYGDLYIDTKDKHQWDWTDGPWPWEATHNGGER